MTSKAQSKQIACKQMLIGQRVTATSVQCYLIGFMDGVRCEQGCVECVHVC